LRFLYLILLPSAFYLSAVAQQPGDLRVTDVRFSQERSPFGGESWLSMEVVVDVRNNSNESSPNREFVDKIELQVALANNMGTQSQPMLEYFWTQVEAPTLKRGSHRFRFYLSPEQIERGRMNNSEPYAWYVQIISGGAAGGSDNSLNPVVAVSRNLREQPRLDRFLDLLEEQKEERAGILLPQAETPFRDMFAEETPTIKGSDRAKE
jgi:hypothetical protein